jgi:calcyphosin
LTEFLVGIKGDLNERRKRLVRMAFEILDKDGSGVVHIEELLEVYDISAHPDVVGGKKTKKEAMKEFMAQWDRHNGDGCVTYEEFEDYYKDLSASIDGDDYFELMIRNSWRIAGGDGASANTANKRLLVTDKDGRQSVVTVEKELGLRPGDKDGYRRRLEGQGVRGEVELHGGIDATDKAKYVEFVIVSV